MNNDLIERRAVLELTKVLKFDNVEGLKHYRYRCIDPNDVCELPSAQPEEAIPISWLEERIEKLRMAGDYTFSGVAVIIHVMLNEWRREQHE